ncbi:MAG: hypothetical protein HN452_01195 [Thaumarchaeota archaeon]|nr:hypothetical protein [Nitrososphaerota archaeon]
MVDYTISKSVRLTHKQLEHIDEIVKEKGFKDSSDLIRQAVFFYIHFLEYDFKYPSEEFEEFRKQYDPLLKLQKDLNGYQTITDEYSLETLEPIFYAISLTIKSKKENLIKQTRVNERIRRNHGVFQPKVGYVLVNEEGIEYYRPMSEHDHRYDELSKEVKETLRIDIQESQRVLDEAAKKEEGRKQEVWEELCKQIDNR